MTSKDHALEVGEAVLELADLKRKEACLTRRLERSAEAIRSALSTKDRQSYHSDGINPSDNPVQDMAELQKVREGIMGTREFLAKQGLGDILK